VHLILQASLLPDMRGRIAMLEMGEPVRIVELAKNLLRLSGKGFRRGTDVVFTGLRWGEKLHEELTGPDEVTTATSISKVKLVEPPMFQLKSVLSLMEEWEAAFQEGRDQEVIAAVASLFPNVHTRKASTGTDPRPLAVHS
jgi:FlaA1/EpsC-like NDP-sugar epimerase